MRNNFDFFKKNNFLSTLGNEHLFKLDYLSLIPKQFPHVIPALYGICQSLFPYGRAGIHNTIEVINKSLTNVAMILTRLWDSSL